MSMFEANDLSGVYPKEQSYKNYRRELESNYALTELELYRNWRNVIRR